MDQQLKERLVGAAVLALLAVLFVPMILDGPDDAHTTRDIPLPPVDGDAVPEQTYHFDLQTGKPSAPVKSGATAEPAAHTEPSDKTADAPARVEPATSAPAAEPEPVTAEPQTAAQSVSAADGWTVQVGSFSTEARAARLRDELRGKGYPAFIVPFKDGAQQYYRVRVGPEPGRAEAEALAKRLQAETGSAVRVVSPP